MSGKRNRDDAKPARAAADAVSAASGDADAADAHDAARASGPDLARAVLDAAQGRRNANGRSSAGRGRGTTSGPASESAGTDGPASSSRSTRRRIRGYSGPGADPRDPQVFGTILARVVKARGWQRPAAEATVFGSWAKVVGPDIAAHCRPVRLEAGELTVEAESTAWATQLRMLSGRLLARIAGELGHNIVTRLNIHGPVTPSWSRGARRVRGPGPRDTYG